ncbi:MAG: exopolysaccharide biosynthesis polyprenyl glycosylphosphotransferase [Flavobacteriaceae bacterium]
MIRRFTFASFLVFTLFLDTGSSLFFAHKLKSDISLMLYSNAELSATRLLTFVFLWVVIGAYFSIYKLGRSDRFLSITFRLVKHMLALFLTVQVFAISIFSRNPQWDDVVLALILVLIQLSFRFLLYVTVRFLRANKEPFKDKIVIMGDKTQSLKMATFLHLNPHIGYSVLEGELNEESKISKDTLDEKNISAVFIHQKSISEQTHKNFLEKIALLQTPIFIFDTHDAILKSKEVEYYGYTPVYKTQFSPLNQGINKYVKRLFDVFFSIAVIVLVMSWLYPIVAILIKLESKGPALFIQNRNGLDNKLFRCYKFRSMTINNDDSQAIKEDNRVTRIGRIIRKTSIDEFPQFFNVLEGNMSVVGPRPHMEIHNKSYQKQVDSFQLRHTIKPGITGLAQMRGFRGEITEDLDIINRVKYDIFYIRNWSFALDIKIIIRTVLNMIKGEDKAY